MQPEERSRDRLPQPNQSRHNYLHGVDMKYIESTLKHCRKCGKKTEHKRNNSKAGLGSALVHLILILVTAGAWLAIMLLWIVLSFKIGGWKCGECDNG